MGNREKTGRAVAGIQLGNMMRPKEFIASGIPVPVDVPRVRYEVLTRLVHVGETPPIADAGPDQIGVPAGTITLKSLASTLEGYSCFPWDRFPVSQAALA